MMLEQTGNKIKCLEGIRGIAAFIVLLHHFTLGFYPAYYSMNLAEGHMDNGNVEKMVGTSLLNFFVNGSMAVSIFFVLSGIVLSYSFFKTKNVRQLFLSSDYSIESLLQSVVGKEEYFDVESLMR